ncbi:coniferyl aldehyde dehydrogenase [Serratia sp. M24T3]|uniref:coniferyl aldehyde dehydrogenase n=1 Tax=Serratia sp. M24T3 TaxID=932213 RepID=UPI00025B9584|nr:coniferyl aldehyde dehydrogenase [Serratia sp. M24T3]EIC85909.1 aldehyde dehydrogenase [Serratia sp. M24T3]
MHNQYQSISISQLPDRVAAMKKAHIEQGPASLELRIDRLQRAEQLLKENHQDLADAICADYGNRSRYQSLAADIGMSIKSLQYARENVAQWMQSQVNSEPMPGMQARLEFQPLGLVGIIVPWNFPLNLAFSPLAGVFAAGNRAMFKPSELTPRTSALLAKLVSQYFDPLELTTVLGEADMGAAFSAQKFDHLIFTGSTAVGRHVMRAAAENLVPVTLELGGKSPVLVAPDANLRTAVERTLTVKTFNAGQICMSPDYVLLPEGAQDEFVGHAREFMQQAFPTLLGNADYTSLVCDAHFQRQIALLEDAESKGATVISLAPQGEAAYDAATRKMATVLVLNATDDMRVMQEEVFGPVLPLKSYQHESEAVAYINGHPRPLAAYYFGDNLANQRKMAEMTTSGVLVINDIMTHASIENLPFGGVGPSGMGAYHGIHGFLRFSHAKAVVEQSLAGESSLTLRAPYVEKLEQLEQFLAN